MRSTRLRFVEKEPTGKLSETSISKRRSKWMIEFQSAMDDRISKMASLMVCRQVFVARDKETQKVRALKRVRMEKEKEGVRKCSCCHGEVA
eukprot:1871593-Rhodomonas_salina.2